MFGHRASPSWVLAILAVLLGVGVALGGLAAYADTPIEDLSPDPTSEGYSPIAWAKEWSDKNKDYDELQQGSPEQYLKESGLVRQDGAQWDALSPDDMEQLEEGWPGGLLKKIWDLAANSVSENHVAARQEGQHVAPEWSPANSDAIATILGGDSYAALSPGLKSIVERAAVIITGDSKPPMPDAEWATWMTPDERSAYDAAPAKRYDWEQTYVVTGNPGEVVTKCKEGMPDLLTSFCETVTAAVEAVGDAAEAAGEAVSFASDPLGWLNAKMAEGVIEVFEWLATLANESTLPDLTLASWISTYQKGFAAGIVIFAMVLMYQFVRLARGKIDSAEMLDSITARTPAFFAGVVFGPPLAQFLIVGASQLTNSIVRGMTGPNGDATEAVKSAVTAAGQGNVLGGAFVAFIILVLMMFACFFIFITLAIQTVTIYLSSVMFAVAFAWIADARRTSGSLKIPFLLIGIIFSRPLLFALLEFGLSFMGEAMSGVNGDTARTFALLVMMTVMLSMIALSPALLLQFAPVMPHGGDSTGGAGGASRSVVGGVGSAGGGSALQSAARPSAVSGAAASGPGRGGSPAGLSGGSGTSGAASPPGAAGPARAESSGISQSGSAKSGVESGSVGRVLGRTRRHGGGAPSAAAAALLTDSKAGHKAGSSGSGPGLGSRARRGAQKAARPGVEAARGVGGNQPWQ